MAGNGSDWNSFMHTKNAQVFLYSLCVFFCLFYAIGGIVEMCTPDRSSALMATLGAAGYYALTITRTVVLLVTAFAFGRIVYKTLKSDDNDK